MEGHAWDGFVWVDGWPMTPPRRQQDQQDPQPDQLPIQPPAQLVQPMPDQPIPDQPLPLPPPPLPVPPPA